MMNKLSWNDLDDNLETVALCMSSLRAGRLEVKNILNQMCKIFQADNADFFPPSQSLNNVDLSKAFNIYEDKWSVERYAEYYWRYDPLYAAQFNPAPTNRVFKTDDIISYPQLKKLDYYLEYLQRINWFGELVIRLCNSEGFWGSMSLSRSQKQPIFNNKDIQKARSLLPYLIDTFEIAYHFSSVNAKCRSLEQCIDSKPDGVMIVDSEFRLIYVNDVARQISQSLFGASPRVLSNNEDTDASLPFQIVEDCKLLASSFRSKGKSSTNRIINAPSGEIFYLRYTIINQSSQIISLPCFVVDLSKFTNSDIDSEESSLNNYSFSLREQTIIQYASIGLTNKEIGKQLSISSFTVQNHLQNIFSKAGIKNRTQLANLMKYF